MLILRAYRVVLHHSHLLKSLLQFNQVYKRYSLRFNTFNNVAMREVMLTQSLPNRAAYDQCGEFMCSS